MELIRGLHSLRPEHRGCAVTVGAFDGIHLGHQAVLSHLSSCASERGLLVHDDHDEEVSAGMFLRSQNAWRGVETFRTKGLGHYRILKDDTVADKISDWLGAPAN